MEYIHEGFFPGMGLSFKMSAKNIDKDIIKDMMKAKSASLDLGGIKETFEYFLKVNISDCVAQKKQYLRNDKTLETLNKLERDFSNALSFSRKMTIKEFFDAKINAQDIGIDKNIARYEDRLNADVDSVDEVLELTEILDHYKNDRTLWGSLSKDEKLFFVAKSMDTFEKQNLNYYQDMEMSSQSKSNKLIQFVKDKYNKVFKKRNSLSDNEREM